MTLQNNLRIAVIGAGGIGGITAALLKHNGYDVTLFCKYEELADQIQTSGLEVSGIPGEFQIRIQAVANCDQLEGTFDLIFHATKATDMIEPARSVLKKMTTDSLLIAMQNGICEDALAEIVGRERIIGCVVGWGATMLAPGKLDMTSTGEFTIGRLDEKNISAADLSSDRADSTLQSIADILSCICPVDISNNIYGNLYSKLIINSCITSLGALSGQLLGEMLADRHTRNVFIKIMEEAMAVARAMNLKVEKYAGKIDYEKLVRPGKFNHFKRHLLIRMIGIKFQRLKSSSLQSLERGKPTEIDYLNGYIVEKAREEHVSVPVNIMIVKMIKEIESGTRQIHPENIDEIRLNTQ